MTKEVTCNNPHCGEITHYQDNKHGQTPVPNAIIVLLKQSDSIMKMQKKY